MSEYLFEKIASQLVHEITEGKLTVGEKLPSERIMADQYNVSRNVIREAIRVLDEKGFVQVMAGRGGFVCKPDGQKLTENLSTVVENSSTSLAEIVDAREVFETAVATCAVSRATPAEITHLESLYVKMGKASDYAADFATLDQEFHMTLARCAGNSILSMLADSIYQLARDGLFPMTPHEPTRIVSAQKEHYEIIQALKAMDSDRICSAIHAHIHCIRDQISSGK